MPRYVFPSPDGWSTFDITTREPMAYALLAGPIENRMLPWGVVKTDTDRERIIEVANDTRKMPPYAGRALKVVKLPEPSAPKVTEQKDGQGRRGSHSDCDHENTSAERRACRARRASGAR